MGEFIENLNSVINKWSKIVQKIKLMTIYLI